MEKITPYLAIVALLVAVGCLIYISTQKEQKHHDCQCQEASTSLPASDPL